MNKIEGYCTQNGEPTPDNPAEIKILELNMIDIVNLKDISERFNNGTETIEDIINYCRNYELYFGSNTTMQVVEKKYFDKLVERIQELEQENRIQRRQLNSAFDRGWIPKEKVKEIVKEAIEIIESEQFKVIMGDMTKVGRLRWLLEKELLEDK